MVLRLGLGSLSMIIGMLYSMNLWTAMEVQAIHGAISILHGVPRVGRFLEIPNWQPIVLR